jgi:hypothetical protein
MSTMLNAHNHRDQSWPAATREMESLQDNPPTIVGAFETPVMGSREGYSPTIVGAFENPVMGSLEGSSPTIVSAFETPVMGSLEGNSPTIVNAFETPVMGSPEDNSPRIVGAFETPVMGGSPIVHRALGVFATALDKSAKPIVSQSFTKSQNNRTDAVNAAKMNRPHQSSPQVS